MPAIFRSATKLTGVNPLKIVSMTEARSLAKTWIDALSIRAIDGNARIISTVRREPAEIVIAKSLVQKPKLVIFDEPTRGVDVGAIVEIHQLINRLADEGFAVAVSPRTFRQLWRYPTASSSRARAKSSKK